MVQRKKRLPVVLDTNVFVRALKAGSHTNWNRRIVRTNDRDLLEVSDDVKQTLKYAIVTPQEFFKHWDAE